VLACLPLIGGALTLVIFTRSFYSIKVNLYGNDPQGLRWWRRTTLFKDSLAIMNRITPESPAPISFEDDHQGLHSFGQTDSGLSTKRRTVLIATLEYEIMGWNLKVRYASDAKP
jgi:alpha-1,3-glucan synthase